MPNRATELKAEFMSGLAKHFQEQGFRLRQQSLTREAGNQRHSIHVNFASSRDEAAAAIDVAIRHNHVEDARNATREGRGGRINRETYTLGVELGNWVDGRRREWTLGTDEDVAAAVQEAAGFAEQFGIPFFERFGSLREVERTLAEDRRDAMMICPLRDERPKILAIVRESLARGAA